MRRQDFRYPPVISYDANILCKWLSPEGNCFTAGGFPSNPSVWVCAEQLSIIKYRSFYRCPALVIFYCLYKNIREKSRVVGFRTVSGISGIWDPVALLHVAEAKSLDREIS
jgi:hypothetical protein